MNELVDTLTFSLVRDFLQARNMHNTLNAFESEKPQSSANVANRPTLSKSLKIQLLMKANNARDIPLPSVMEVLVDYLYKTSSSPDEIIKKKMSRNANQAPPLETTASNFSRRVPRASPSPGGYRSPFKESPDPNSPVPERVRNRDKLNPMERARSQPKERRTVDMTKTYTHQKPKIDPSTRRKGAPEVARTPPPRHAEENSGLDLSGFNDGGEAFVSSQKAKQKRGKVNKPKVFDRVNKSEVEMRSEVVDQQYNVMEMKMKAFKSDLLRLKDMSAEDSGGGAEKKIAPGGRTVPAKKTSKSPPPKAETTEEMVIPGANKTKKPCGLCGYEFTPTNLPGLVTLKAVCDLREKWGVQDKIHIGGKGRFPTFYNEVRLCRFCFQFFDSADYYRPEASPGSPGDDEVSDSDL